MRSCRVARRSVGFVTAALHHSAGHDLTRRVTRLEFALGVLLQAVSFFASKIPGLRAPSTIDRDMTLGSFGERTSRPIFPPPR